MTCPKCGFTGGESDYNCATRQGPHPVYAVHVIDMGFGCPQCNHEFGFEVFG